MDDARAGIQTTDPDLFRFSLAYPVPAISLRYFDANAEFVSRIQLVTGCELPGPLEARETSLPPTADGGVLAWRSPTETLLLAANVSALAAFDGLPASADGCAIDLTGAFSRFTCAGRELGAVFARLGGTGIFPGPGEAKRGRLADMPAFALSVREGECLILVEHYYARHLGEWIRQAVNNLCLN